MKIGCITWKIDSNLQESVEPSSVDLIPDAAIGEFPVPSAAGAAPPSQIAKEWYYFPIIING